MTNVIVCGSRHFENRAFVYETLTRLHARWSFEVVLTGGAEGVDKFADQWAYENGIHRTIFMANWKKFGNRAGPIRNQRMIIYGRPDLVVAFPGGAGTADMMRQARESGVQVIEISEENDE